MFIDCRLGRTTKEKVERRKGGGEKGRAKARVGFIVMHAQTNCIRSRYQLKVNWRFAPRLPTTGDGLCGGGKEEDMVWVEKVAMGTLLVEGRPVERKHHGTE